MKAPIIYCSLFLFASCGKGGGAADDSSHNYYDPNDYTYPTVVVNTPTDSQAFPNGSSIDVTGNVSDNSLYQGSITMVNDNSGLVVKDQNYEIHYIPSYNFSMSYVASVSALTSYTITVKFEDHGHNVTTKTVKVTVNP